MALLEARLTEEKEWRKQLELDLSAAQTALKKDKEVITKRICLHSKSEETTSVNVYKCLVKA